MECDNLIAVAGQIFGRIKSVKKVFMSESNSVVTILDNPERIDRCNLYDAERKLAEAYPECGFTFYSTTGEADYSTYEVIYERH